MKYQHLAERVLNLSNKYKELNREEVDVLIDSKFHLLNIFRKHLPTIIEDTLNNVKMLDITKEQLEKWSLEFFEYYKEYIISAHLDENEDLVVVARPELEFQIVLEYLTDTIQDTVNFKQHLAVHLYEYGIAEFIEIQVN